MVAKGMVVKVYGKKGCGKCEAAKDKLKLFGIPFTEHVLADAITLHDDWRTDGSAEVLACYSHTETLPVILLNGQALTYPETMKRLKTLRDQKPSVQPVVGQPAPRPAAQEAVAV